MPPVVLITDLDLGDGALERELLREHLGTEPVFAACRTEAEVLHEVAVHRPTAIITQWAPITARVIETAAELRIISRFGIGVDMIDVASAQARAIEVRNVPHYCTEEVATHAVALILALWRRVPELDRQVRAGTWDAAASAPAIGRLSQATVGLVGAGRIGARVGRALEVWGARVVVSDPFQGDDGFTRVPLDVLAATSDVISLHAPLTAETHHLVDRDLLAVAERRPFLVNTSRGALADLAAVADALDDGRLRGAGIDVFEDEPLAADSPIRRTPNTILTPHAAWCSADALPELRRQAVLNVVDALAAEPA